MDKTMWESCWYVTEATLEGWASVRGDGLQLGLEESLQLPLHNGLEESISSLCHLASAGLNRVGKATGTAG